MQRTVLGEISQISIMTPIKDESIPGDERLSCRESLELILGGAMNRITQAGHSALRNVPTLVFAQWTLLDLKGPGNGWLLLSAAFNGEPVQYLTDLRAIVGPEMDAIYQNCLGYPGSEDEAAFLAYAASHTIRSNLFYPTSVLRHETIRDLRRLTGTGLDHLPGRG